MEGLSSPREHGSQGVADMQEWPPEVWDRIAHYSDTATVLTTIGRVCKNARGGAHKTARAEIARLFPDVSPSQYQEDPVGFYHRRQLAEYRLGRGELNWRPVKSIRSGLGVSRCTICNGSNGQSQLVALPARESSTSLWVISLRNGPEGGCPTRAFELSDRLFNSFTGWFNMGAPHCFHQNQIMAVLANTIPFPVALRLHLHPLSEPKKIAAQTTVKKAQWPKLLTATGGSIAAVTPLSSNSGMLVVWDLATDEVVTKEYAPCQFEKEHVPVFGAWLPQPRQSPDLFVWNSPVTGYGSNDLLIFDREADAIKRITGFGFCEGLHAISAGLLVREGLRRQRSVVESHTILSLSILGGTGSTGSWNSLKSTASCQYEYQGCLWSLSALPMIRKLRGIPSVHPSYVRLPPLATKIKYQGHDMGRYFVLDRDASSGTVSAAIPNLVIKDEDCNPSWDCYPVASWCYWKGQPSFACMVRYVVPQDPVGEVFRCYVSDFFPDWNPSAAPANASPSSSRVQGNRDRKGKGPLTNDRQLGASHLNPMVTRVAMAEIRALRRLFADSQDPELSHLLDQLAQRIQPSQRPAKRRRTER